MTLPIGVRPTWWRRALGLAALLAVAVPVVSGQAQAAAQEDVTAPTGRAVCNTAFTAVAVLGFGNFIVPADAALGPNDIVTALRPVLELCVSVYPPRPPTRCEVTSSLIPATPIPITPPDVGGILAEQTDALLAALGEPVATALGGPLRDLFIAGLGCGVPHADDALVPDLPPAATPPPSVGPGTTPPDAGRDTSAVGAVDAAAPVDHGAAEVGQGQPDRSPLGSIPVLRSALVSPLRGAGSVLAVLVLALLGLLLSRQLAPRRPASLDRARGRR